MWVSAGGRCCGLLYRGVDKYSLCMEDKRLSACVIDCGGKAHGDLQTNEKEFRQMVTAL